ncbi:hypothetical protein PIB30_099443, partial [Stylosanthes scabra]|nr:hypothetical protein [Stylosanthes scabra]
LFQAKVEEEEEEEAHEPLPTKPEKIIEVKSSKLELKPLPPTLKYAFLDAASVEEKSSILHFQVWKKRTYSKCQDNTKLHFDGRSVI